MKRLSCILGVAMMSASVVAPLAHAAGQADAAAPAGYSAAAEAHTVVISDREFNRIVFRSPFKKVIFPPGAPLKGDPLPLSDNHSVLFQVEPGARGVIQMVVQLKDGNVETLRLEPAPVPGVVYRVDGAPDVASAPAAAAPAAGEQLPAPRDYLVETFRNVLTGNTGEFSPVEPFDRVQFDRFTAEPIQAFSNGADRMLVFQLTAREGMETPVAASQFYRRGVRAVQIEGEVVGPESSPHLYILVVESIWFDGVTQ